MFPLVDVWSPGYGGQANQCKALIRSSDGILDSEPALEGDCG
jgi:hypothetical protein